MNRILECREVRSRIFSAFSVLVIFAVGVTAWGQAVPIRSAQAQAAAAEESFQRQYGNSINGPIVGTAPSGRFVFSSPATPVLSKENKKRSKVDKADELAYRDFLKGDKTGILKLINPPDCSNIDSIQEQQKCFFESYSVDILANSYSFRDGRHNRRWFADLTLRNESLVTGPQFAISFMTNLGDIPIDKVGLDSLGVGYVAEFVPSESLAEANKQAASFNEGSVKGNFTYLRGVKKARKDTTFVLRSHGYKVGKDYPSGKADDVIIVFRVLRVDDLGDVTIVWKELQRKKGKKLEISEKK